MAVQRMECIVVAVEQTYICTFGKESLCSSTTDTRGGAGDDDASTFETSLCRMIRFYTGHFIFVLGVYEPLR
ncbi:hypothetical protein D3C75_1343230 [compost metagenome]